MSDTFDPSAVAVKNGAYFCFEGTPSTADFVFLSIPWDVTTSYRPGTRSGPNHVLDASAQVDLYSPDLENVWELKLGTIDYPREWDMKSLRLREKAARYIEFLESGGNPSHSKEMIAFLAEVNHEGEKLHAWAYETAKIWVSQGKTLLTVGGDHSVSLGPIRAVSEKYPGLSILHFDAHADLRVAYEGFTHSHASIMDHVARLPGVSKLVQVGIRDVSQVEIERIESDPKVKTYFDWDMKTRLFKGEPFAKIADEILSQLGPNVYVSFDIDGLDPKLCPHTGTPVPGGLEFEQATYLIQKIVDSGRKLVGADLVEVAPNPNDENDQWNGNVGARMLFQILIAAARSKKS